MDYWAIAATFGYAIMIAVALAIPCVIWLTVTMIKNNRATRKEITSLQYPDCQWCGRFIPEENYTNPDLNQSFCLYDCLKYWDDTCDPHVERKLP